MSELTIPQRGLSQARWYVNRLRCMSPAEIPHRLGRAVAMRLERYGLGRLDVTPAPRLDEEPASWIGTDAIVDPEPYLAAARRVAAGRVSVFELDDVDLGNPPLWNRDPKTGIEAPLTFGKLLDYRDPSTVGDIKYVWEPNRHQHLVTLAQAWALSRDMTHCEALRAQLESWFEACPYRMGPNWASALEPAIRLINWSIAWQLLGGNRAPIFAGARGRDFRDRWLGSVFQHCHFVAGHFSLHSSANNHLIGEASGLLVGSLTWPCWSESPAWRSVAKRLLETETLRQNAPDGVNREQAVGYQQFELDLLLLAVLAGQANDLTFDAAMLERIEAMIDYLGAIMDCNGNMPMFGDSDDGYVVRLSQQRDFCPFRSVLAAGAVLFGRPDFKAKAGALDDKTRWLLGAEAETRFAELPAVTEPVTSRAFPDGGYYVLGTRPGEPDEIKLVADAGPLGYGGIAAHGHADALSFTLSVGGREFFVDPGTYAYRTGSKWRDHFRGTAAHNTARVDGEDQSIRGGNFMWLTKAQGFCHHWQSSAERDVLEAGHDGYRRLADPVEHWRRFTLDKAARRVVIEDAFNAQGRHDIELFFHCSEHCIVTLDEAEARCTIRNHDQEIVLVMPRHAGATVRCYAGDDDTCLGWNSRRFGSKHVSTTLVWHARIEGDTVLRTDLIC